jgi:glycosyltransferase domain-containing protein
MAPRLTIVMPLRGRNLFTLRFLYHANRLRMPFRFLIADGLVHPKLADMLENSRQYFPNLDIEYLRYPDDQDFSYFFNKMADALSRTTTPYAMLADNDDFLGPAGIASALDFLDANTDYIGCSGRIFGFSTYSGLGNRGGGLRGRLNRLFAYYRLGDASAEAISARFTGSLVQLWPYYAIVRTDALATVCREVAEISFSDLQVHESFHVLRLLSLGRVRMLGSVTTLMRQTGTSLNASFKKDWVHHLVRSRLTHDIDALVMRISTAAAAHGADQAAIREQVYDLLDGKFRQMVKATYGSLQEVKRALRRRAPGLVLAFKNRPRLGVASGEATLTRELRQAGATPEYLGNFHTEIAELRDVLSGPGLDNFLAPFLPVFEHGDATHGKSSNLE